MLGVGISATEFHLIPLITRRNILDVAPFHIAMLWIREDNSFVPESKKYGWMRGWLYSLRCSWSDGRGERGKEEVEEQEENHGVDKRHQISVTPKV